ncbi:MAG: hypothetical protein AAFQ58_13650 [Pseudomonadota bacterium]
MRWLLALMLVAFVPAEALASSYHQCSSPLVVPAGSSALPLPELEFTLTLQDQAQDDKPFMAKGQRFNGLTIEPVVWRGMWVSDDGTLRLIGAVDPQTEWRAMSVWYGGDVIVLNIDQGATRPLMVRCLPREGA